MPQQDTPSPTSILQLAATHHLRGDFAEAADGYSRIPPGSAEFTRAQLYCAALIAHEQSPEAAKDFLRSTKALGAYPPGLIAGLGDALEESGHISESLSCYRLGLLLQPGDLDLQVHLGNALFASGALSEAIAIQTKAHANKACRATAHNLGRSLAYAGRLDEACALIEEAAVLAEAEGSIQEIAHEHSMLGHVRLLNGDYSNGWPEFAWRTLRLGNSAGRRFAAPVWDGSSLSGRTLLIYEDEGFGDTIQFSRYLPLIPPDVSVVVEVRRPLARLIGALRPGCIVRSRQDALHPFDAHISFVGLAQAFGTTLSTIPAAPYLRADEARVRSWRARLGSLPGLRAGIVWAGSPHTGHAESEQMDRTRSLPLAALAPLARAERASFVSLQKGEPALEARECTPGLQVIDFTRELHDFSETAALIQALDLVITVDTSVVHLAGALGKPTWLLNRFDTCWRWGLGSAESAWYPTVRQFRQQRAGDWTTPIEEVADELVKLANSQG